MVNAEERYWRQVPKVNVLQTRSGSVPQKALIFRVLLVLVVLVGAFLIFTQRTTKSDIDERIAENTAELRRLQSGLNRQRQGINDLYAQINELNARREAVNQAIRVVTANNIDWFTALESLYTAQTSGVIFLSVFGETGSAVLQVGGVARGEGSKASLPSRFSSISESLDFQSILWAEGSNPPVFTATFRVGQ